MRIHVYALQSIDEIVKSSFYENLRRGLFRTMLLGFNNNITWPSGSDNILLSDYRMANIKLYLGNETKIDDIASSVEVIKTATIHQINDMQMKKAIETTINTPYNSIKDLQTMWHNFMTKKPVSFHDFDVFFFHENLTVIYSILMQPDDYFFDINITQFANIMLPVFKDLINPSIAIKELPKTIEEYSVSFSSKERAGVVAAILAIVAAEYDLPLSWGMNAIKPIIKSSKKHLAPSYIGEITIAIWPYLTDKKVFNYWKELLILVNTINSKAENTAAQIWSALIDAALDKPVEYIPTLELDDETDNIILREHFNPFMDNTDLDSVIRYFINNIHRAEIGSFWECSESFIHI